MKVEHQSYLIYCLGTNISLCDVYVISLCEYNEYGLINTLIGAQAHTTNWEKIRLFQSMMYLEQFKKILLHLITLPLPTV